MSLRVLIVGAGVCGPAFATLLQRSNPKHNITIVERATDLRDTGQQVDLKTQAPHILRAMNLMDEIKSHCVNETGMEVVDSTGRQLALFGVSRAGQTRGTLTSEFEIMRGDLARILYKASLAQTENPVRYIFGQTITALNQANGGVDVTFSDGQQQRYDLVVGADGQYSRTRKLAFGEEVSRSAFKSLGIYAGYFSAPRIAGEGSLARLHFTPGRCMLITRTSDRPVTGVLMFTMAKLKAVNSIHNQKEALVESLKDCDWQKDRFVRALRDSDDFYGAELCQIKMDKFHTGRTVLLGDAGYCPTPLTGLGTNLCLVGAYVLAGELARHTGNVEQALKNYDKTMRPIVDENQKMPISMNHFFPSSRIGIWAMNQVLWVASKLVNLVPQSDKSDGHETSLPDYPELNLKFSV